MYIELAVSSRKLTRGVLGEYARRFTGCAGHSQVMHINGVFHLGPECEFVTAEQASMSQTTGTAVLEDDNNLVMLSKQHFLETIAAGLD